nr:immunoglobulin light chain junction region [Macaca mulatta]MOV74442.1 immunoglobulin light chain junction region [Macaca mulatta]MOV75408.1 immunoglobulin light chain junction region [Macaca mulatta]MOV75715.1 immunoglobulin light chain junction region [Macaca mulatta]MOV77040.1 immunoglobulin light chain junction region [Macaca mulatta]
CLQRTNWWTF